MWSRRLLWMSIRRYADCKATPIWRGKFAPPCNIAPCVFIDKPMETEVTKDGVYQNPEYKSYHAYSYLDMQLQLDHCRLEQPVADETDCRGKLVYTRTSEPKCGGIIQ